MFPQINNYESERLIFRDLEQKDAKKLLDIYADKEAMKYRGSKAMTTIDDAVNFIINQKTEFENVYTIRKGIETKEKKELIGSVMYKYDAKMETECEIGYSIGANFWNRGFGRAIIKAMLKNLKEQGKITLVKAWTRKGNVASTRILELNGFQQIEQDKFADAYLYVKKL